MSASGEAERAVELWARSGAMALTAAAGSAPVVAGAGAAAQLDDDLQFIAASTRQRTGDEVALPGVELLGERVAISGQRRSAGSSVGGAARTLRAADGWWMLSLARPTDHELVPALVEAQVTDPWSAVRRWSQQRPAAAAVDRAQLLGLAAAAIPPAPAATDEQLVDRREQPVVEILGGRTPGRKDCAPLVVDLSALWAGPLCAHLLGLAGAHVVKVESTHRHDGARQGPAAFYDLLHAGHDSVEVDLRSPGGRDQLRRLLDAATVVVDSARPRAMHQLGIDVAGYVARGKIWTAITAYGRTGPWADRVGFGDDVAAAAGLVAELDGVPVPVGDAIADPLAGACAAAATAAALATGHGRLIDVSMRGVARAAAARPVAPAVVTASRAGGWTVECAGARHPVAPPTARRPRGRAAPSGTHNDHYLATAAVP